MITYKIIFNIITFVCFLRTCLTNSTNVNIPFDGHFHDEPILPFNTWGSFRGLHYFGLKTSSPNSPAIGLIWFNNNAKDVTSLHLRHWCSAGDNLIYGWKLHNFDDFGFQQIIDNDYKLNTSFIKFSQNNWKSKISVNRNQSTKNQGQSLSLVLYFAKDRESDSIKVFHSDSNSIQIDGNSKYIGNFSFSIKVVSNTSDVLYTGYLDSHSSLVNISHTLQNNLKTYKVNGTEIFVVNSTGSSDNSSLIAFQVVFHKESQIEMNFQVKNQTVLNDNNYDKELEKRIEIYGTEFGKKFPIIKTNFSQLEVNFAKAVLSEMLGSIGYFYGKLLVDSPGMTSPKEYGPLEILSAVPSRPVFPRPFLWDEGFHNLLIFRWNSSLSLKIIKSWFNLMNIEGWIPREITLDNEGKAKVGQHFWTQHDDNANPPSFLLTIDSMLNNKKIDVQYLKALYPRLQAWFVWYNTTQIGNSVGTYRWRGRDKDLDNRELNPGTLTSGLDDYPRATHPTDSEYHLDLRCWIALAADVMARIASLVADESSRVKYEETAKFLTDNQLLNQLHWSEAHKMYCDYGLHSTNVSLIPDPHGKGHIRKVWTPPEYQFVCELGYVNLFPLMFKIIDPQSPQLGNVLDSVHNSSELWTPYGLRSISKTSLYYNAYNSDSGAPYWRGAIWINLNYLVLRSLHYYSGISGPNQSKAAKIYSELRQNLITNMFNEYKRTGFVWEQYNDNTGVGQDSHPFVGWSAVVVLIMSEDYGN